MSCYSNKHLSKHSPGIDLAKCPPTQTMALPFPRVSPCPLSHSALTCALVHPFTCTRLHPPSAHLSIELSIQPLIFPSVQPNKDSPGTLCGQALNWVSGTEVNTPLSSLWKIFFWWRQQICKQRLQNGDKCWLEMGEGCPLSVGQRAALLGPREDAPKGDSF